MANRNDTFRLAIQYHLANRQSEAEALCHQLIASNPADADSLHLLGTIKLRMGEPQLAINVLQKAAAIERKNAVFHLGLGIAHMAAGHANDAIKSFKRALALNPKCVEAHSGLATAYKALGNFPLATANCRTAIALKPDFTEAHLTLGTIHQLQGAIDDALECYKRVLAIDPQHALAYSNLGSLAFDQHRPDEALEYCRYALRLKPDLMEAHLNMGLILRVKGNFKEAAASFGCAIALRPTQPEPYAGLGIIAGEEGRIDDALDYYRRALDLSPDNAGTHWNRAVTLLRQGRLSEGWKDFDWRWDAPTFRAERRPFSQPLWNGEIQDSEKLLIWGEQGVGDEILFASAIPDVAAREGGIVIECDSRLVPLFGRSWPNATVIARTTPPDPATADRYITHQTSSGTLCARMRPDFNAFPKRGAYLTADSARKSDYHARLRTRDGHPVVGISWASKNPALGKQKSMPLMDWKPILEHRGLQFADLQYGDTKTDRAEVKQRLGVDIAHFDDVDNFYDLDGLAALISACDLVITVSNATAHLAGALGVPVWILVPAGFGQTWYWFMEREDCAWYPSARLFRQSSRGEWKPVIKQVSKALSNVKR